jgi:hypothetical protein
MTCLEVFFTVLLNLSLESQQPSGKPLPSGRLQLPIYMLWYKGTHGLVHRQEPLGLGHTRMRGVIGLGPNSAQARVADDNCHNILCYHAPTMRIKCGHGRGGMERARGGSAPEKAQPCRTVKSQPPRLPHKKETARGAAHLPSPSPNLAIATSVFFLAQEQSMPSTLAAMPRLRLLPQPPSPEQPWLPRGIETSRGR